MREGAWQPRGECLQPRDEACRGPKRHEGQLWGHHTFDGRSEGSAGRGQGRNRDHIT